MCEFARAVYLTESQLNIASPQIIRLTEKVKRLPGIKIRMENGKRNRHHLTWLCRKQPCICVYPEMTQFLTARALCV